MIEPPTAVPQSAPRMTGSPLAFLVDDGFRTTVRAGRSGVAVRVRLTSYRSLPLSCLREITLSIDGTPIDASTITFVLDGHGYPLAELRDRTDLWWYILDPAELFIPLERQLAHGQHTIEGSITTIVPFATGGRTTSTDHSSVTLELDSDD